MSFNEWKSCKLDDFIEVLSGYAFKSKDFKDNGVPVIKIKNIIPPNIDFSDVQYVSQEMYEEKIRYALKYNDILISLTGSNINQINSAVGKVGRVKDKDAKLLLNQRVGKVYVKDENKYNNDFLYYFLIQKHVRYDLALSAGGSANQANINPQNIKDLNIQLPPIEEQKAIANILSILDNKIEVNNKINQKLEEMAQAIFKQWFIDFDFPNEEGKPYKSSGGEMIKSELGMIPKGWKVGVFRNYITDILGGDWGKEVPQGNYIKEVQCIRGADIPEINKGNEGKAPTRFILEKNFKNKQLTEGNLIVEISGGSPTQSTGRISYINDSVLNKFDKDIVCTNFCRAMTLKDRKLMEFVYIYWSYLYNLDVFFQFENGTTGIKNLDINNFLDRWDIVNPSEELINKYYEIARDLFIKIQDNGKENERLSRLRDTLLPKLMSGEIRVPTNN